MYLLYNIIVFCYITFLSPGVRGQISLKDALCARIYIHIANDDIVVKVLEGVYIMQNYSFMDFPVYKSVQGPMLWYYSNIGEMDHMLLGESTDNYYMHAKCKRNPVSWRDWWTSGNYPFTSLIDYWRYYDAITGLNIYLGNSVTVKCVTYTFDKCSSGKLYFDDIITHVTPNGETVEVSDPDGVYFEEIRNISIASRPVFRKIGGFVAYLYYLPSNGAWVIGVNYDIPDIFMKCADTAFRPENLICYWQLYTSGSFQYQINLNLECHGFLNGTCDQNVTENSCENGGLCSRNSLKEVVCHCPRGYHGETCQFQTNVCPLVDELIENSVGILAQERYVGDRVGHICVGNAQRTAVFSLCVDTDPTPDWLFSNSCSLATTIPTTARTTTLPSYRPPYPTSLLKSSPKEPLDFDDYWWVLPTVVCLAVLLQVTVPILVHFVWAHVVTQRNLKDIAERSKRLKRQLSRKELKKRRTAIDEQANAIFNDWGNELNTVTSRYSTMSGEDISKWPPEAREEIDQINDKYRRQTGEVDAERKDLTPEDPDDEPKKKFYWKNVSCGRTLSLNMFISFWLWIIYVSVCYGVVCHHRGFVFVVLLMIGFIMIGLAWMIMSCESLCSREKQYLSTLGDIQNARAIIEDMRNASPALGMKAVAWHMEQRTRLVTTTDANGNVSSSVQTYWERVDTAVVEQVFQYGFVSDHSDKHIEGIRMTGVTKIKMNLNILFGDEETEEKFNSAYRDFQNENRNLDVNVDFSELKELPGFKKRVATYMDENTVPCWMNMVLYGIMSFFALTWVFRVAFRCSVAGAVYDVNKKVYLRKPEGIEEERLSIYRSSPSRPANEVDGSLNLQERSPKKNKKKQKLFATISV